MIVGAFLEQQEREKRISVLYAGQKQSSHYLRRGQSMRKNDFSGTGIPKHSMSKIVSCTEMSTQEKIIAILQNPQPNRSLQDTGFLQQELEKIKYFASLKRRREKIIKDIIPVLTYRFVVKGEYVLKKDEIGQEFFIILSGSCLVLDDIEGKEDNREENNIKPVTDVVQNYVNGNNSPTAVQLGPSVFSNFRQTANDWSESSADEEEIIKSSTKEEEEKTIELSTNQPDDKQQHLHQTSARSSFAQGSMQKLDKISPRTSFSKLLARGTQSLATAGGTSQTTRKSSLLHALFKSTHPGLKILKLLGSGESFGEKAILDPSALRTAYVQAKDNCHLLVLQKKDYLSTIGTQKNQSSQKIGVFLQGFKFLEGWQFQDLCSLGAYFQLTKMRKGETIFTEGDFGSEIYIIMKGCVKVTKQVNFHMPQVENLSESRQKKNKQTIEIVQLVQGEIFGEESALSKDYSGQRNFSMTVESVKATVIKAHAQIFYEHLWDPVSKKIYLQQMRQKCSWRTSRFQDLFQKLTKKIEMHERLDHRPYAVEMKVQAKTPTHEGVISLANNDQTNYFNSIRFKEQDQDGYEMSKTQDIQVSRRNKINTQALLMKDLTATKEDLLKKLPITWHLRAQELVLQKASVFPLTNSIISDTVQRMRPCTAKIDEKRKEIFETKIKSGFIVNKYTVNDNSKHNISMQSADNSKIHSSSLIQGSSSDQSTRQTPNRSKQNSECSRFITDLTERVLRKSEENSGIMMSEGSTHDAVIEKHIEKQLHRAQSASAQYTGEKIRIYNEQDDMKISKGSQDKQYYHKIQSQKISENNSKLNKSSSDSNKKTPFSLFESEYGQLSKEESDRMLHQESRFNKILDRTHAMQVELIEKDVREALSAKGQQIARGILEREYGLNDNYILRLFGQKEKFVSSSLRLQRINHYSKLKNLQNKTNKSNSKNTNKEDYKGRHIIQQELTDQFHEKDGDQGLLNSKDYDDFNFKKKPETDKNVDLVKKLQNRIQSIEKERVVQKSQQKQSQQAQESESEGSPTDRILKPSLSQQIYKLDSWQSQGRFNNIQRPQTAVGLSNAKSRFQGKQDSQQGSSSKITFNDFKKKLLKQFFKEPENSPKNTSEIDEEKIRKSKHDTIIRCKTAGSSSMTTSYDLLNKIVLYNNPSLRQSINSQQQYQQQQQSKQSILSTNPSSFYDVSSKHLIIKRPNYVS